MSLFHRRPNSAAPSNTLGISTSPSTRLLHKQLRDTSKGIDCLKLFKDKLKTSLRPQVRGERMSRFNLRPVQNHLKLLGKEPRTRVADLLLSNSLNNSGRERNSSISSLALQRMSPMKSEKNFRLREPQSRDSSVVLEPPANLSRASLEAESIKRENIRQDIAWRRRIEHSRKYSRSRLGSLSRDKDDYNDLSNRSQPKISNCLQKKSSLSSFEAAKRINNLLLMNSSQPIDVKERVYSRLSINTRRALEVPSPRQPAKGLDFQFMDRIKSSARTPNSFNTRRARDNLLTGRDTYFKL